MKGSKIVPTSTFELAARLFQNLIQRMKGLWKRKRRPLCCLTTGTYLKRFADGWDQRLDGSGRCMPVVTCCSFCMEFLKQTTPPVKDNFSGEMMLDNGEASSLGDGPESLHEHLDNYQKSLDRCEDLETKAFHADQHMQLLEELSPVLRAARNMQQVLEEARKAVPEDRDIIDFRDRAYEIARTAELLYGDAKNAMDVAVVRRAEEQAVASNRMAVAAHRLNVLLAMFFPIATMSAMFSTVFTEGWQISDSSTPFILFIGIGLVAGLILTVFITRRASPQVGP